MSDNNTICVKVFKSNENRISKLSLEYIVKLIIISHYNNMFHNEFLKALAVIYRTQIIKKMLIYDGKGCSKYESCDICDNHCIDIKYEDELKKKLNNNFEKINKLVYDAVAITEDQIITFNRNPIDARITDTCGGSTQNSENVLPNKISYLRRVLCDYCTNSENWKSVKEIDIKDIEKKLKIRFPKEVKFDININEFIEDVDIDEGGRVISVKIGGKVFNGTELIELLNIDSTKLNIQPSKIRFISFGKGDGLGLCLNGANEMAKQGYSYEEIIKYYYTGVEIDKLTKPCIKKPLNGKIIMLDPGHGGEDSEDNIGTIGLRERDVVLKISKNLSKKLTALGAKTILTREDDVYMSLSERSRLANKIRPNFFISIHLNSFMNTSIHGCEIYHYRKDKEALLLSQKIMESLVDNLEFIDRGIKVSDFFLLREVGVTCVHLEVNYISNVEMENNLKDDKYLEEISKYLCEGIVNYYLV